MGFPKKKEEEYEDDDYDEEADDDDDDDDNLFGASDEEKEEEEKKKKMDEEKRKLEDLEKRKKQEEEFKRMEEEKEQRRRELIEREEAELKRKEEEVEAKKREEEKLISCFSGLSAQERLEMIKRRAAELTVKLEKPKAETATNVRQELSKSSPEKSPSPPKQWLEVNTRAVSHKRLSVGPEFNLSLDAAIKFKEEELQRREAELLQKEKALREKEALLKAKMKTKLQKQEQTETSSKSVVSTQNSKPKELKDRSSSNASQKPRKPEVVDDDGDEDDYDESSEDSGDDDDNLIDPEGDEEEYFNKAQAEADEERRRLEEEEKKLKEERRKQEEVVRQQLERKKRAEEERLRLEEEKKQLERKQEEKKELQRKQEEEARIEALRKKEELAKREQQEKKSREKQEKSSNDAIEARKKEQNEEQQRQLPSSVSEPAMEELESPSRSHRLSIDYSEKRSHSVLFNPRTEELLSIGKQMTRPRSQPFLTPLVREPEPLKSSLNVPSTKSVPVSSPLVHHVSSHSHSHSPSHSQSQSQSQSQPKMNTYTPLPEDDSLPTEIRMRNRCINEIIQTERDYVSDLKLILDAFYSPLKRSKILQDQDLGTIFGSIQLLLNFNQLLLTDLEEKSTPDKPMIGSAFMRLADFLKMYSDYCVKHHTALEVVENLKAKNSSFARFLIDKQSDLECRGLALNSFLIKPVQRVCKYPLLLRDLLKYTKSDNPDHQEIMSALGKIETAVATINESKRSDENRKKIVEIQSRVEGGDKSNRSLIAPSRRFIREALFKVTPIGESVNNFEIFYLFNDLLLRTVPKKKKNLSKVLPRSGTLKGGKPNLPPKATLAALPPSSLKIIDWIELPEVILHEVEHTTGLNEESIKVAFELHYSKGKLVMISETPEEKEGWFADIKGQQNSEEESVSTASPNPARQMQRRISTKNIRAMIQPPAPTPTPTSAPSSPTQDRKRGRGSTLTS